MSNTHDRTRDHRGTQDISTITQNGLPLSPLPTTASLEPIFAPTPLLPAGSGSFTNPMTTQDDIIVGGSAGAPTRLAKGSDSQVLTVDPTTHHLVWANSASGFSNPMTTRGDIIIENSTPAPARLAIGSANKFLHSNGTDPSWQQVVETDLNLTDVTTANVSITAHGFAPKGPNDATKYLDGTGAYSTPAGGGGGSGYDLDTYTIDGTYGDDFTSSSLSGIWTRRNFTSGAETRQLGKNATYMRVSTSGRTNGDGYFQTAPAGDWTFAMAFVARAATTPGVAVACIDSSGTGVAAHFYSSPQTLILIGVTTYSTYAGTFTQRTPTTNPSVEQKIWIYLKKSSATYTAASSFDGEIWSDETAVYTPSAFTVNRVGFFLSPLGTIPTYFDIDWFNKIA